MWPKMLTAETGGNGGEGFAEVQGVSFRAPGEAFD